jgi:hypothetical protein
MEGKVRRGFLKHMLPLPGLLLKLGAEKGRKKIKEELVFMTEEHRKVHHFVVREMPSHGRPMDPDHVAGEVNIPLERVVAILQELEERMMFLFRNDEGAVVWAYPVTAEETPHQLTFSTGEEIYAA